MRIALCDSNDDFLKETKKAIYRYANIRRIEVLIDLYRSGEALLCSEVNYGIIFLEYNLDGMNGLETAKRLRLENEKSAIVFISSYTGFIFDSFTVNPYRFLVKPLINDKLFSVLDDYFRKHGNDYPLWIKQGDETVCLKTNDILYLEANNKYCFVNLLNEKIGCNKTMARVYETLPKCHFGKINRAYIVNFNYITSFSNDEVCLANGHRLHISRNFLQVFKQEYRTFSRPLEPK